jgi:predicted GNAT family acetyltransferase
MNYPVINNPHGQRFETTMDGHVAVLNYKQDGRSITFLHTEVPQQLAGRGVGSALAKTGLKYAREQGLQVIPKCEFMASYIEKHPEFADLLGSGSSRAYGF